MMAVNERTWQLITICFFVLGVLSVTFIERQVQQQQKPPLQKLNVHPNRLLYPSPKGQEALRSFAAAHKWVAGIAVMRVNLVTNTREPIYGYFKAAPAQAEYALFLAKPPTIPVFNGDKQNNTMILNLINGELGCHDIAETVIGKVLPALQAFSSTVCAIPLPPGYGDFVGYLNIFLTRFPSEAEVLQLYSEGTKLALTLYEREVLKRSWID